MHRLDPALSALPAPVAETVRLYLDLLRSEKVEVVQGLYLLGSVALGDYQAGSDVDFAAVVASPLDDEMSDRLDRIHRKLAARDGPFFDGFYLPADQLDAAPDPQRPMAFSQEGKFYRDAACFECNPVVWLLWATRGIALFGPKPASLTLVVDPVEVRRFQLENLSSYWQDWVATVASQLQQKSPEDMVNAQVISWGVLGVSRIAYTLETGLVASKLHAGEWVLQRGHEADDAATIRIALDARRGEISRISRDQAEAGLALIRKLIDETLSAETEAPRLP